MPMCVNCDQIEIRIQQLRGLAGTYRMEPLSLAMIRSAIESLAADKVAKCESTRTK